MTEHKTYREAIQQICSAPNAKTQRARILSLLIDARGGWPTPEPEPAKSATGLPDSADWYERQHGPRPAAKPLPDDLPLFARVGE